MSPSAWRRAVAQGNGWYGFLQDEAATQAALRGLAAARERVDRPESLGALEISITPPGRVDRDRLRRFEDLGVDRLVLTRGLRAASAERGADGRDPLLAFVEDTARELGLP